MKIFTYVSLMVYVTTKLLFFAPCEAIGPRVGINYGTNGNDLPPPSEAINLIKQHHFKIVRIFDPHHDILDALKGSTDIEDVLVGVGNENIVNLANDANAATSWVSQHVIPYNGTITYVVVGNEVIPGPFATNIAKAMANVRSALDSLGFPNIKVTSTVYYNLQKSYPPSAGVFAPEITTIMKDVLAIMKQNNAPLLVSMYPYYAYVDHPNEISFEYATFGAVQKPVQDGNLQYFNILDAQIDAYHAALDKIGFGDINVIIVETGWPTAGHDPQTNVTNAQTFNSNLIKRIMSGKGTPKFPDVPLEVVIFALFDENLKVPMGYENYWGLFTPDMKPKYQFD